MATSRHAYVRAVNGVSFPSLGFGGLWTLCWWGISVAIWLVAMVVLAMGFVLWAVVRGTWAIACWARRRACED